jgi:hypothetical protein
MNPPPEGWHLVLEFVKALAGPTAAVLAVWIASSRALRGFRVQKALERRLDWYESMIQALAKAAMKSSALTSPEGTELERRIEADRAITDAVLLSGAAEMYADAEGVRAMDAFAVAAKLLEDDKQFTKDEAKAFLVSCAVAAGVLSEETRKDLRLRRVRPLPNRWWRRGG